MKQSNFDFDVVVIGGGHAGCEAAAAADRMSVSTCLITHRFDRIGEMSCNPAIGGIGKGHLVREIDALDGLMGRVADKAGIQFRLLNRRKGPAVRGPRAQCDRDLYRQNMQAEIGATGVHVIEGEVVDLLVDNDDIRGVMLGDGSIVRSAAVIVTTGTFLRGVMHVGKETTVGGRMGDRASVPLADRFRSLGLPMGRLKTGTPPRLDGTTIDWDLIEEQDGDDEPELFSFLSDGLSARQIKCGITYTTNKTHDIVRENIDQSAMWSGRIEGVGPRYCPSIEDKIMRFADKDKHQIFLEPEGLSDTTIYPNGISTSLPIAVQEEYVRTIPGLSNVVITQHGYAIEYDYVDPRALSSDLSLKCLSGLFLAGQINGTTGYEEAAAQGLVAGLNAAQLVKGSDPFAVSRAEGYIGVLIDDLVSQGVTEPYRMFTSRAEYRLSLRIDNADSRLTPLGLKIGCVGEARARAFSAKMDDLSGASAVLASLDAAPSTLSKFGFAVSQDGRRRTCYELLAQKDVRIDQLARVWPEIGDLDAKTLDQLKIDAMYSRYVDRQDADALELRAAMELELPEDMEVAAISGLSNELKEKIAARSPRTLAEASSIEGMTPSALLLIRAHASKRYRAAS